MWQKREYWEGLKEKWDIRSPGSGCADLKFVEKQFYQRTKFVKKLICRQLKCVFTLFCINYIFLVKNNFVQLMHS